VVAEPPPAAAPEPIVIVSAPPSSAGSPPSSEAAAVEASSGTATVPEAATLPGDLEAKASQTTTVEIPFPAPPVIAPTPPPLPRIGEKVGFIQLPQKPAPKTAAKVAPVKLPTKPLPVAKTAKPAPSPLPLKTGGKPGEKIAAQPAAPKFVPPTSGELITLKPPIVVRDLAEKLSRKPFQLIADLMELGVFANVNQAIDETTAQRLCAKHGFRFEVEKRERGAGIVHAPPKPVEKDVEDKPEDLKPRAPVVTIMGHVDHGKTTLLDVIRQSNVAAKEAGGITQHIGAYTISIPHPERKKDLQQITFLDTPGHAAFSSMRARGANVTDIVVLVVAADDGVMPQTLEALSHAQAAKVPIIVAVNKCDHPNANPMKVRQQLQDKGLVCEEWGGNTIFVDVSALTKQGVDKLLEMIVLQAEVMELKANPTRSAKGNVIESGLEPGGPTATVLVRKGTLHVGDIVICGQFWGKVRALINEEGKRLKEAGPSVAVKVLGLNGVPEAGLEFSVVENDKDARVMAEERTEVLRNQDKERRPKVTLENLFETLASESSKALKVVVKADTQGSVEAIVEAIKKIESTKVSLEIVHSAVGTITESDVLLASASQAIVLGFHTRIDNGVSDIAKREGVQIKLYAIIYELIDEVKEAMAGLLDPLVREVVIGSAEVRKIFTLSKGGNVAGCVVSSGRLVKGKMRVQRRKGLIFEGVSLSLRRFQDEVSEVRAGMECGIRLDGFNDFQVGDVIECYTLEKVPQKL
jgi:translation initiation factor IF-2